MARRVALGTTADGYTYFRVSKPGYDVFSDTNSSHFLMHEAFFSGMPVMNAVVTATQIVDAGTSYFNDGIHGNIFQGYYTINFISVAHNLGFVPFIIVSGDTNGLTITVDAYNINIQSGSTPSSGKGWTYIPSTWIYTGAYTALPIPLNIYVYGTAA